MKQLIALSACGILLASCASMNDPFTAAPSAIKLRLESEPAGAEARVSASQACNTPCELTVTPTGDVTVTYSLAGYQSQSVVTQLVPAGDARFGEAAEARLNPNPVTAELEAAPAPAKRPAKRRAAAKRPAAAESAPEAPAPAAPQNSPFPPPPASAFPPPSR